MEEIRNDSWFTDQEILKDFNVRGAKNDGWINPENTHLIMFMFIFTFVRLLPP